MMDKSDIPDRLSEIIWGKFQRLPELDFPCVVIRDPELARRMYLSTDNADFDGKYDNWMSLTEGDYALQLAAMEGISLGRRNFFGKLLTHATDATVNRIKHYGGFPGGTAEPLEIAEDFRQIFTYAMATFDSGKTERLYEEMFLAYQSGGWPCGWLGKYPEGKIVVFYPS